MRIVILTENTANGRGLLAEHGLSVLVEAAGKRILFDTGQSDVYLRNAGELGESLEGLDGIVLSHGHYDHTGGLPAFPEELPAPVFVRENAFEEKLSERALLAAVNFWQKGFCVRPAVWRRFSRTYGR